MTDITAGDGVEGWLKRADRDVRSLKTAVGRARVPRTCTSTTRPDPSNYQPGVLIFEMDTNRLLTVNATQDGYVGLAREDSPAFTGTPTAPTAGVGTSTTQLATTAFVMSVPDDVRSRGGLNNQTSWNSLYTAGVYQFNGGSGVPQGFPNDPNSTYAYGLLLITRNGGSVVQQYFEDSQRYMYYRSTYSAGGWNGWVRFAGTAIPTV